MSLHDITDIVNTTLINTAEPTRLLTPGQIAAITISSVFAFYIGIMCIVCVGEYCQYITGKKEKPQVTLRPPHHTYPHRRSRSRTHSGTNDNKSDGVTPSTVDQSDLSLVNDRTVENVLPVSSTTISTVDTDVFVDCLSNYQDVLSSNVPISESVSSVTIECEDYCDSPYLPPGDEQEMMSLPLMSHGCEGMVEMDGDVLGVSVDSKDYYKLEADV